MSALQTSIATVSLSGDLRSKLQATAKAGFAGVELFENDLLTFDGRPSAVRQLLEDLELRLVTFQPFRDFEGMPEPLRAKNFDRAEHKFDVMQALGTDLMLVCSNVSPASLGGLDRVAEDLHELGERAKQRGLRIGFEALAWGKHINDYRDAWEAVRRANHDNVGTILDSFHILAKDLPVGAIVNIPKEKIFLVQVADAPKLEMGVVPWSRHYRNFPGQGRLPLQTFMQALAATRYDGFYSLEIFNDQFRAAPAQETALDGLRSLHYLAELLPDSATNTSVRTHGIAFVEFAVAQTQAQEIATQFERLGFVNIGKHRSKNVSLWRQGKAQLIVNTETQGFAHKHWAQHGPSVCALALEVDGVERALQRAQTFRYPVLHGKANNGEHQIPAVVGVDGSLIYLLEHERSNDDFWRVDFELTPSTTTNAHLERVDHIGQVLPFATGLSWRLFYRTLFGLETSNLTDIPDPSGLVQSQVVENQDKSLRLVLNATQFNGTLAAQFLTGFFGGGVQHVAFSCQDIFATLEAWQENGVAILQVSENYYADLGARFGLDANTLARMQRLGVLYDQNEHGQFFHAYTQTFANMLFFEVCQRLDYDAYGAPNASIRIAAQARLAEKKNT